jgi:diguanylate cyclase (GGDEF) domain
MVDDAASGALLDGALAALTEALIVLDARGVVREWAGAAESITGHARPAAIGRSLQALLELRGPDSTLSDASSEAVPATLRAADGRVVQVELWRRPLAGGGQALVIRPAAAHATPPGIRESGAGWPDPMAFVDRVQARSGPAADDTVDLLGYLDVDQFKRINDTYGRRAGEAVLRGIADTLVPLLGPDGDLARIGGDQFALLLRAVPVAQANPRLESLLEAVRRLRLDWQGSTLAVTASLGAVALKTQDVAVEAALTQAEIACRLAKEAGHDRLRLVDDDADVALRQQQVRLVGELDRAEAESRLELYFEDVVSLRGSAAVVYREMLLRLRGGDGRQWKAQDFIGLAERYYRMRALDLWTLRATLRLLAGLPDQGIIHAVNVSAQSLSDDRFLDEALRAIADAGIAPSRLCFEITETAAISHLDAAQRSSGGCPSLAAGSRSTTSVREWPRSHISGSSTFTFSRSTAASCAACSTAKPINR